jgi:hypothetical protein
MISLKLMMCKNQHGRPTMLSLMEDLKQKRLMTTIGEHRWGAGQSSSDAFVRDFGRMINR